MTEREHTNKQYEQRLRTLKERLLLMGHSAETMIADCIRALADRRPSLVDDVIARDDRLDMFEIDIDDLCYEVLALDQPVARDLRFLATTLKIVGDIERVGDIAVNISRRTRELLTLPALSGFIDLPYMAQRAQLMFQRSLDAFMNSDPDLAESILRERRLVHDMHDQISRELLALMVRDPQTVSAALELIFIAKHLERVGDHSCNIAEMVVFLVRGQDIRHGSARLLATDITR